ncbi:MAG: hypothetical protein ACOYMF_05300 [Bacteroidales bacterium]
MKYIYSALVFLTIFLLGSTVGIMIDRKINKDIYNPITGIIPGDDSPTVTNLPVPEPVYRDTGSIRWYPSFRDTGSTRWMYHEVDTMAILKDYYSRVLYNRTLKDDSSAYIFLTDTVFQNKLWGSKLVFKNRRPCSIVDTSYGRIQLNYSPVGLYAGFAVGRSSRQFGIGPSMMLLRKNACYSVVYDITNKDLYFNFSAPLWKPRKVP